MIDDLLSLIEKTHNCNIYFKTVGKQEFLELYTLNTLTFNNIVHIRHLLGQYDYHFYKVEALDDNLILTYYKKR